MKKVIVLGYAVLIATYFNAGFGIRSILSTVSTVLYSGRMVGYFITTRMLIGLELTGFLLSLITQLMFKKLDIKEMVIYVIIRLVFLCIYWYESGFIYITEEKVVDEE